MMQQRYCIWLVIIGTFSMVMQSSMVQAQEDLVKEGQSDPALIAKEPVSVTPGNFLSEKERERIASLKTQDSRAQRLLFISAASGISEMYRATKSLVTRSGVPFRSSPFATLTLFPATYFGFVFLQSSDKKEALEAWTYSTGCLTLNALLKPRIWQVAMWASLTAYVHKVGKENFNNSFLETFKKNAEVAMRRGNFLFGEFKDQLQQFLSEEEKK